MEMNKMTVKLHLQEHHKTRFVTGWIARDSKKCWARKHVYFYKDKPPPSKKGYHGTILFTWSAKRFEKLYGLSIQKKACTKMELEFPDDTNFISKPHGDDE